MKDPNARYSKLRHIAVGALAALAVGGGIAGTAALAAQPGDYTPGHAAANPPKPAAPTTQGPGKTPAPQSGSTTPAKTPAPQSGSTTPTKTPAPQSGSNPPAKTPAPQSGGSQPFLAAVQGLVEHGTITPTEAQVVDREIRSGMLDTQTLASSGLTPSQLQAVQLALANTKRALAAQP